MSNVPWLLPGLAISIALASAMSLRAGGWLGGSRTVTWMFMASAGTILSATLTPLRDVLESGAVGTGGCDVSRVGPAPLAQLVQVNDVTLNILLFFPMGIAIGLIPTWRSRLVLIAVGAIGPFVIEAIQGLAPILGRGCEAADIFDNLTGLAIGVIVGAIAAAICRSAGPPNWPASRSGT